MLRAAADSLYGSPHIALSWHQVPARRQELRSLNPSAFVNRLRSAAAAIRQYRRPHHIAVPFDHGVGTSKLMRFHWIKRRVNASEDHVRATIASQLPNFITAKRIRSVNADADN